MDNFISNPVFYISALFASAGAFGFLIYLRGFIGSIGNVFTKAGHDEHVHHAQVRVIWGILILTATFIVWEIVRWVLQWFF
jgi:hypothetical protein